MLSLAQTDTLTFPEGQNRRGHVTSLLSIALNNMLEHSESTAYTLTESSSQTHFYHQTTRHSARIDSNERNAPEVTNLSSTHMMACQLHSLTYCVTHMSV